MEIGKKLRQIRTSKKISIYKLSQETGISQNHIKDLENGHHNPSLDTLTRLIVPLGITLPELFNDDTEISYLTERARALVEVFRLLPDARADLLLSVAQTFIE